MSDRQSLEAWVPRLVAAWRRLRGGASGSDGRETELSATERRDIVAGAAKLTEGLTRERELVGARYFDDPQLLGAYLLLYWPVSYAQARSILGELPSSPGEVLDVGAGPGPLALAALDAGARSAHATDPSERALAVAKTLGAAAGHALSTEIADASGTPSRRFDTILLGHVLNELAGGRDRRAAVVEALLTKLSPGGQVVVIEPALRETSRALLELRDLLVERGVTVRAPCLYRGACPALEREGDWCHAERRFTPPPLVEELAEAAKLHRDSLKMSYLVLQAPGASWPEPPRGRVFRIVSEPLDRKGQHRFVGCGPEGRTALVLPTKNLGDDNRVFTELTRGDVARVDGVEPRGDGLRLERGSRVERVAEAGAPVEPEPR